MKPVRSYIQGIDTIPALAFSIGMIVSGVLVLFVPTIQATSLTLASLPRWITMLWGASLLIGGSMGAIGIHRSRPDFESGGFVILASAQIFAVVTSIAALGLEGAALGILLRGSLAVSMLGRVYFLTRESE